MRGVWFAQRSYGATRLAVTHSPLGQLLGRGVFPRKDRKMNRDMLLGAVVAAVVILLLVVLH